MTDRPMTSPPSSPEAGPIATVSELVTARERRGMTTADVAQRLKLHLRQLEAIERGDWNALPGKAFARGSVRAYARLVGVDAEPLLAGIGGFEPVETLKPSPSLQATMPRGSGFGFDGDRRFGRWPWALLGLAGVIGLAWVFGRDGDSLSVYKWTLSPPAAVKPEAPASGPAPEPSVPTREPAAPPVVGPSSEPSGIPAAPGVPVPPTPAVTAPAAVPAPLPPASAGAAPLRLLARQEAWIEIKDATGKLLQFGAVKPGQVLELSGTPPYAYTIGNASQVSLEFQGKPVDLKPLTIQPNNIAKGRLP